MDAVASDHALGVPHDPHGARYHPDLEGGSKGQVMILLLKLIIILFLWQLFLYTIIILIRKRKEDT